MKRRPRRADACTRTTAAGSLCTLGRISWPHDAASPDPRSCERHLTGDERVIHRERRDRVDIEVGALLGGRLGDEPACWSWQVNDQIRELFRLAELTDNEIIRVHLRSEAIAWFTQGRCGLCGVVPEHLVDDHDHDTGLRRGGLCRSCNVREGLNRGGVFALYRRRYPFLILGISEPYTGFGWDDGVPVGGWPAVSVPGGMVER